MKFKKLKEFLNWLTDEASSLMTTHPDAVVRAGVRGMLEVDKEGGVTIGVNIKAPIVTTTPVSGDAGIGYRRRGVVGSDAEWYLEVERIPNQVTS